MALDKARIRFRKSGDLRFVSHLDLMRSFERLLRRASIPFRMTEGFHPSPRLSIVHSLPLGVVGQSEVADLEMTEELDPQILLDRLRVQAPPGIDFLSAIRIPLKATARPRRAFYRITGSFDDGLAERCQAFLAATEIWADRIRPRERSVNIRPYVQSLAVESGNLRMALWLTTEGTARAEEILNALGMSNVNSVERTYLELLDDVSPAEAQTTPKIEPQTRPLNRTFSIESKPSAPRETWGATANGPIVE